MLVAQMPNREYYAQMQGEGDLFDTIRGILFYGSMEFVSLVVLEVVQLAFLLQKQVDGVQTKLLFWVFYFSQSSLVHFGAWLTVHSRLGWLLQCSHVILPLRCACALYNYTFTFPWLRGSDAQDPQR